MDVDLLKSYQDSRNEIDRIKLRFNGIGPRIHDQPNKIWPRDSINPDDESKKILYPTLIKLIDDNDRIGIIRLKLKRIFNALKRCNVQLLFNKYCRLDHGYFDRVAFKVYHALDAHNSYNQILAFVHGVLLSINSGSRVNLLKDIFGSNKNLSIFKSHIKWLVCGNTRLRRITIADVVLEGRDKIDFNQLAWLDGLNFEVKARIFMQLIFALFRFVAELLRRYFYITISNPYLHKLFYFRYDLWQKIQYREIDRLIKNDVLNQFKLDSSTSLPFNEVSKMKFYLKKDGLRLICTRQKDTDSRVKIFQLKAVLSFIATKLDNYKKFKMIDLLEGLKHFKNRCTDENKTLYIVRADIKDCFQSIEQMKLRQIILDILKVHSDEGNLIFHKVSCALKCNNFRARRFREVIRWTIDMSSLTDKEEFERVHVIQGPIYMSIQDFDDEYLKPHIINPLLRESRQSKTGYNLLKGLRQGLSFSPLLCSIYIQTAFNKHLGNIQQSGDCRLFRYVDDILFISTDSEKSQTFMKKMISGFKDFRLRMNVEKLACNFEFTDRPDYRGLCRLGDYATFYKKKIAIDSLQCSYDCNYNGIGLYYTFHASPYFNHSDIEQFIMKQSKLELIHLDYRLNGFEQVIQNIFKYILLIAHRLATIMILSFRFRKNQQPKMVVRLIGIVTKKLYRTIEEAETNKSIRNNLTYQEIRLMTIAAFRVTWSRDKVRYRNVEYSAIDRRYKRSKMNYLIRVEETQDDSLGTARGVELETEIEKLVKTFPKSSFATEVILPKK